VVAQAAEDEESARRMAGATNMRVSGGATGMG
jgi:hypothetical protein